MDIYLRHVSTHVSSTKACIIFRIFIEKQKNKQKNKQNYGLFTVSPTHDWINWIVKLK